MNSPSAGEGLNRSHSNASTFIVVQEMAADTPVSASSPSRSNDQMPSRRWLQIRLPDSPWTPRRMLSPRDPLVTMSPTIKKKPYFVMAISQICLVVALEALTITGYVIATRNLNAAASASSSGESSNVASSPAFIDALFIIALLLLSFALWRSVVKLCRLLIYPLGCEPATPAELVSPMRSAQPNRVTRFFFGSPPDRADPPTLPDYETALRQAARQGARRRAAEQGVSAGRRGREQFATGDAEDLEIERVLKLGGLPPLYRSTEMRKSTVLLRGTKPERRLSILSMFSNSTNNDHTSSPSPTTSTGRVASIMRRISDRLSSSPNSPVVPSEERPSSSIRRSCSDDKLSKEEEHLELQNYVARNGAVQAPTNPNLALNTGVKADRPKRVASKSGKRSVGREVDEKETVVEDVRGEEEAASGIADAEAAKFIVRSDSNALRMGEAIV